MKRGAISIPLFTSYEMKGKKKKKDQQEGRDLLDGHGSDPPARMLSPMEDNMLLSRAQPNPRLRTTLKALASTECLGLAFTSFHLSIQPLHMVRIRMVPLEPRISRHR